MNCAESTESVEFVILVILFFKNLIDSTEFNSEKTHMYQESGYLGTSKALNTVN